jgi:8-oxo-dGTP pyrophosphatase MutT (NUDIX family)
MSKPECVVLWVQNEAGEVLTITRKHSNNSFGLIGGKVDEDDTNLRTALVREVLEETGVDLSDVEHESVITFDENGVPCHCFIYGPHIADMWPVEPYNYEAETMVSWRHIKYVLLSKYSDFHEYNKKVFNHLKEAH